MTKRSDYWLKAMFVRVKFMFVAVIACERYFLWLLWML